MVVKRKTSVNLMSISKTSPKQYLAKRRVGRPSNFSQKVASSICELLVSGKSLREICKRRDMPSTVTRAQLVE